MTHSEKTIEELKSVLLDSKKKLCEKRFANKAKTLLDTSSIKKLKQEIASAFTWINIKKRKEGEI